MNDPSPTGGRFQLSAALAAVVMLWAALYLPCLGTIEMKGEEARRTLPAVAMLESGDWMIPYVGGEAYARKPPPLNWSIALAIKATGHVHEWTARLPSALAVLPMALGMLLWTRRLLGTDTALLAAVMYLVNATMLEKGRLAELESFTITTYGLAFLAWFHGELYGSRFKCWILAGICLSLGQMTKGPMPTLLFFYLPVVLHFWRARRMRELISPGHLACVALTLVPFLIWSQLMFQRMGAENVSNVWSQELAMRVVPANFRIGGYLEVILRGWLNFMPWVIFAPLLWRAAVLARIPEEQRALFVAVRRAIVIGFVVVGCLPGARPRYTTQLLVPLLVLIAWALVFVQQPKWWLAWRRLLQLLTVCAAVAAPVVALWLRAGTGLWLLAGGMVIASVIFWKTLVRAESPQSLGLATGVAVALLLGVGFLALGSLGKRLPSPERQAAREIQSLLPAGKPLTALRPGYERILVHLGFRVNYALSLKDLPAERPLVLFVYEKDDQAAMPTLAHAEKLPLAARPRNRDYEIWRLNSPAGPR